MFFERQKSFLTHFILLIGLLAFLTCQVDPILGGEHGPAESADESCQTLALPSAHMSAPGIAGPAKASGFLDGIDFFPVVDHEAISAGRLPVKAGAFNDPGHSPKRYQFICTYRL